MSASTQTTRDELQDFLQFIRAESFEPDPLFVTLVRLWRFPGSGWRNRILSFGRRAEWAEHITARCRWCGQGFIPEPRVLNAVASIARNANSSPGQSDRNAGGVCILRLLGAEFSPLMPLRRRQALWAPSVAAR